ncbi:MAG: hypothetical protein Q9193_006235, partial [Seirophora villosa]
NHQPNFDKPNQAAPPSVPEQHAQQDQPAADSSTPPSIQRWLSETKFKEPWNPMGVADAWSTPDSSAKADMGRPLDRTKTV